MRKSAAIFATFSLIAVSFLSALSAKAEEVQQPKKNSGALIVETEPGYEMDEFVQDFPDAEFLFDNFYRIEGSSAGQSYERLLANPAVVSVEEDYLLRAEVSTNDPLFVLDTAELSRQWYLPKIRAHQAWQRAKGDADTTIAIVDTGINGKHEDLNDGRVVGGYANYCQVKDSSNESNCVVRVSGTLSAGVNSDDNGHGTIVAGIIGAVTDNRKGIAGINWNVKLMPIKVLDSSGAGQASDAALGIRWASDNGADIINLSIGGPGLKGLTLLQEAINYAYDNGSLVVAAAGNDAAVTGGNLNENPVSPVCMDGGDNRIVGVTAVDFTDKKARFANYGSNCVDLSAPGTGTFFDRETKQGMVSTYYDPTRPGENDLYVYAVGTSLASPIVSGVAGLVLDVFPHFGPAELRNRLLSSVDNIENQNQTACEGNPCGNNIGTGRINAQKAVSTTLEISNGSLVQSTEGDSFLIEGGEKRPISEFVRKQRFSGAQISNVSQASLDLYPTGDPVAPTDGTVIKEPSHPLVYLVEGGEKLPLSFAAFVSRDLNFSNVVVLPAEEVVMYKTGDPAKVLNGALLKSVNSPAVYYWQDAGRLLVSFFVYKQRGFEQRLIAELPPEQLAEFPLSEERVLLPPLDGTLVRGDQNATVYLIEAEKKRGLSLQAFQNRGFSFDDVNVLPQSEINLYEEAGPLLQ